MPDKNDYTESDMLEAATMLDRMSVTLSHGGRRAAKMLANIFMGIDVTPQGQPGDDIYPGAVVVLLPCREDGEQIGHVFLNILIEPGDDPVVSARFEHLEDSGAFEDNEADNPVTNPNGHPDKGGAQEQSDIQWKIDRDGGVWQSVPDMSSDKYVVVRNAAGENEKTIPRGVWNGYLTHGVANTTKEDATS